MEVNKEENKDKKLDIGLFTDLEASELMDLVSVRLKEAAVSTQKANRTIDNALKKMSKRN